MKQRDFCIDLQDAGVERSREHCFWMFMIAHDTNCSIHYKFSVKGESYYEYLYNPFKFTGKIETVCY